MRPELSNGQSHFWQWDTGQKIKVDGAAKELHYIDIDGAVEVGEDGWAAVPDELLQKSGTLLGWAYLTDHTIERFAVGVSPRSKPPDYVYTPTEVKTWEELRDRLEELEKSGVPPETLKAAVESYLQANPVKETDPTVPAWAKAPEKPTYTAGEVGAISADALQAATENALAQAKASGAFDGPKGDPGKPGKDGAGLTVTGATVGQIVKIAAVDESGTPTAWEPVDMIGGSRGAWELIGEAVSDGAGDTVGIYVEVDFSAYGEIHIEGVSGPSGATRVVLSDLLAWYDGTLVTNVDASGNPIMHSVHIWIIGDELKVLASYNGGYAGTTYVFGFCNSPRKNIESGNYKYVRFDANNSVLPVGATLKVWGAK